MPRRTQSPNVSCNFKLKEVTKNLIFYDFLPGDNNYYLMELIVSNAGLLVLNGQTFDIEELDKRIDKKQIRTNLPVNSRFSVHGIGYKILVDDETYFPINEAEFVKDITDQIKRINGEPTSADKCLNAFRDFLIESNNELLRQKLEDAYNLVPIHNRIYILGDMGSKDNPLRWAINKAISKDKMTIDYYYHEYFGKFENQNYS
jgi:hypothetical protein